MEDSLLDEDLNNLEFYDNLMNNNQADSRDLNHPLLDNEINNKLAGINSSHEKKIIYSTLMSNEDDQEEMDEEEERYNDEMEEISSTKILQGIDKSISFNKQKARNKNDNIFIMQPEEEDDLQ